MKEEVITDIKAFIQQEVINDPEAEILDDTPLITGGWIDSMGIVRLMVHLQERYEIDEFDRNDLIRDSFGSVRRVATMVMKYLPDAAPETDSTSRCSH